MHFFCTNITPQKLYLFSFSYDNINNNDIGLLSWVPTQHFYDLKGNVFSLEIGRLLHVTKKTKNISILSIPDSLEYVYPICQNNLKID